MTQRPIGARIRPWPHLATILLGLLLCAWTPLKVALPSSFHRGLLDPGDSRFAVFVLERNTEWLLGTGRERAIWDLGIFHPRSDVLLFSDTYLGQTPFWLPLRLLTGDPIVAYHLLLAALLGLNFLVAHRWLVRRPGVTPAGAFLGALLFAIGSSRVAHLFHLQLVAQFPLVLLLDAGARALAPGPAPTRTRQALSGAWIGFCWAFLFHLSPYLAWFAGLAGALALPFALLASSSRSALRRLIRERAAVALAAALVAGALVSPVADRYYEAAKQVGTRPADEATPLLIPPSAWFYQGPWSLLYSRIGSALPVARAPYENEMRLGVGFLTTLLVLWGLWGSRRRGAVIWTVVPVALLCALLSRIGDHEAWSLLRPLIPAAGAFRAMSRAGLLALVPAALGLSLAFSAPAIAHRRWLVAILGVLVVAEQAQDPQRVTHRDWLRRSATLAAAVPGDCASFFYSPTGSALRAEETQLDAMWASLLVGIPTINGYSGALPRDWALFDHALTDPASERAIASELRRWLRLQRLESTCWLRGTHVTRFGRDAEVVPLVIFADGFAGGDAGKWLQPESP